MVMVSGQPERKPNKFQYIKEATSPHISGSSPAQELRGRGESRLIEQVPHRSSSRFVGHCVSGEKSGRTTRNQRQTSRIMKWADPETSFRSGTMLAR
jgi:hypothetical protein